MSRKKLTWFQNFLTFLALTNNQFGHINPATGLEDPDYVPPVVDPDKNPDGSYKASFVEKLLREKNNFKSAKEKAEADLAEALKGKPAPKPDDKDKDGDDKYKELLRAKDEENKKDKDKLAKLEKERTDAMKLGTLKQEFDKNGGNAKQWELIQKLSDTTKILIDEDTGVVYGAETEIKRIKDLAPEFFGKQKKDVNDGDNDPLDRHDNSNKDIDKTLEGRRLKNTKEGKNPLVDYYAAQGLKVTDKRQ